MIGRTIFLILICVFFGLSTAFAQGHTTDAKRDRIKILNVSSASPVKDGVANEFTIEIDYFVDTADEAMISIGFNTDDPGRYRMTGEKKVSRGANVITLKARVTPKDWKERGDFIVNAIIAPYPRTDGKFHPFAATTKVIEFEQ